MAYVNAEIEPIEAEIRSGWMTIEQGQAEFANRIAEAEAAIQADEASIAETKESIAAIDSELESLREESKSLSNEIGELRWQETSAHQDGDPAAEASSQALADCYEKQRDEIDSCIGDLCKERDGMHEVKYDQEQQLDNDKRTLDSLHADKQEFDSRCERIREENERLRQQRDLIEGK